VVIKFAGTLSVNVARQRSEELPDEGRRQGSSGTTRLPADLS